MAKNKRPTLDYVDAARRMSRFVPGVARFKRRKTLKPWEKAMIARYEKRLRYADNLFPVNAKQAAKFHGQLYAPGVRAIQLKNVGRDTRVKVVKDNLIVTSNGRTYLYWRLPRKVVRTKKGMRAAGKTAFELDFPMEQVAELARVAFEELHPQAVYLWNPQGRAGAGFADLKQFLLWLNANWNSGRYSYQEKWVNGLVILLHESDEDGADDESEEDSEL